ncbi:MAG: tRNA 2-thiocytidine biosynthesis protein TtcA [Firmicutes bacterium]|nr:tRNA 2-thiocytidine biosynthesis protein TtcA [Bacillota bacterium]
MDSTIKSLPEIERNLITTYRRALWAPFTRAVRDFQLIAKGDRIAVGVSGGKDSLLLSKLLQEIQAHGPVRFALTCIAMDPGFSPPNRALLEENCAALGIPVTVFDAGIFGVVDKISREYPCYLCAKMRRGALYRQAQDLGCNKLALAHHFDDAIETTMLNLLYCGTFKTMLPKLKSQHFAGLELIRPLYYVRETDVNRFIRASGITPMRCGCAVAAQKTGSKRREVKELITKLREAIPDVDQHIFNAAQNVDMYGTLGWKTGAERRSFLDDYESRPV